MFDILSQAVFFYGKPAFNHLRGACLDISYKKLWKLLIDRDLKKKDLEEKAGISHYTMHKLLAGENVTTETLGKICKALGCTVDDIMEITFEEENECRMSKKG